MKVDFKWIRNFVIFAIVSKQQHDLNWKVGRSYVASMIIQKNYDPVWLYLNYHKAEWKDFNPYFW